MKVTVRTYRLRYPREDDATPLFPALFTSTGDAVLSSAGRPALAALFVFSVNVPTAARR
jgi:hypothetical protein